jgi:cobalt/nickel transport system permease protein
LIALFLQALLFGYGGLTTLGLNTFNMALPAIMCYGLFRACAGINVLKGRIFMCGFLAGVGAILLAAVLAGSELLITDSGFRSIVGALFIAHIPVMVIEGFITGSIAAFLMKVRPEMLEVGKEHREEIEKK